MKDGGLVEQWGAEGSRFQTTKMAVSLQEFLLY